MAERQPVVKRSCAFCQDADRETLEQTLLDGNMTVKQMDKEMGWRANTADRHFRNHMGDYHMAANPSCLICTHPQRAEFESQYFDGAMTSDEIAEAVGCSESSVYHHIKNHFQPLVQRAAVTEVTISVGNEMNVLRGNVEKLNGKLNDLMDEKDIHDDGFIRDAVTLHKEVRESIKDLSKLSTDWGSSGEGSQVNQTINIMKVELAKESPDTWKRIKQELVGQMGEDL